MAPPLLALQLMKSQLMISVFTLFWSQIAPPKEVPVFVWQFRKVVPITVRLALEYMGVPKNSVRTFDHALEIVKRTGRDNVGLLPDTWHHFAGGSRPEDFLKAEPDQIFTVHVSDAPNKAPLTLRRAECIWPGDGAVPITAMLQNLQKIGYDDVVSVEVFDPDIQRMPAESCIPLAYKKTVEALRAAGVMQGKSDISEKSAGAYAG